MLLVVAGLVAVFVDAVNHNKISSYQVLKKNNVLIYRCKKTIK